MGVTTKQNEKETKKVGEGMKDRDALCDRVERGRDLSR